MAELFRPGGTSPCGSCHINYRVPEGGQRNLCPTCQALPAGSIRIGENGWTIIASPNRRHGQVFADGPVATARQEQYRNRHRRAMELRINYPDLRINEPAPMTFYRFMVTHRSQPNGDEHTNFVAGSLDHDLIWYMYYLGGFRDRDYARGFQDAIENRFTQVVDSAIANFGFSFDNHVGDIVVPSLRRAMLRGQLSRVAEGENSDDVLERRAFFRSLANAYIAEFAIGEIDQLRLQQDLEELERNDRLELYGLPRRDHTVDYETGVWTRLPQRPQMDDAIRRPTPRAPIRLQVNDHGDVFTPSLPRSLGNRQNRSDQSPSFEQSLADASVQLERLARQSGRPATARSPPDRGFFADLPLVPRPHRPGRQAISDPQRNHLPTVSGPTSFESRFASLPNGRITPPGNRPQTRRRPELRNHNPRYEGEILPPQMPQDQGALQDPAQRNSEPRAGQRTTESLLALLQRSQRASQEHQYHTAQRPLSPLIQPPAPNPDARPAASDHGTDANPQTSDITNRRRHSAHRSINYNTYYHTHYHQAPFGSKAPVNNVHDNVDNEQQDPPSGDGPEQSSETLNMNDGYIPNPTRSRAPSPRVKSRSFSTDNLGTSSTYIQRTTHQVRRV
jgi:hypothetical protein